jgi:rSAM/selenodomain-associated transferase 1
VIKKVLPATIVIMVKVPDDGLATTRLQADLGSSDCSRLAAAFLRDTVEAARQTAAHVFVAFSTDHGTDEFAEALPVDVKLIPQSGSDYGERIIDAISHALKMHPGPVIAIGTDSPTMPLGEVRRAIDTLFADPAQLVLGPTPDGSFWLIGTHYPLPKALFDGVVWGTTNIFKDIIANTRCLAVYLTTVREWYDVETVDDLRRLAGELQLEKPNPPRTSETWRWILENVEALRPAYAATAGRRQTS